MKIAKLLVVLGFGVLFAALPVLAQQKGDVLVLGLLLRDDQVKVTSVVQGPAFDQSSRDKGEYRAEVYRDGQKIASRFFDLVLGETRATMSDGTHKTGWATRAMDELVLPIDKGGTTDQFVVKLFRGTQEVFASSLDKLPFRRDAGITDPIRSKKEVELLKLKPQATIETPGETASSGFPWSFIILGAIILLCLLVVVLVLKKRRGSSEE